MPSQTNEYSTNGITYRLKENGVNGANEAIVKKVDPSAIQNNTLTIPAEITKEDKEYHVTTLAENAICNEIYGPDADNLKNLEEISFEGPITLKSRAISNCYNLKTLRFEAEVKLVEDYAIYFLDNHPLQNKIQIFGGRNTKRAFVDIDQNNKEIIKGNVICYNGTPPNQIEIDFQDMIKENENFCYVEDGDEIIITKIKEECGDKVIIPEQIEGKNVVNIDSTAFDEVRDQVKDVDIKSNIKIIEKGLFKNCKILSKLILPSTIETIEDEAFYNAEELKVLAIQPNENNNISIAQTAFDNCEINIISTHEDVKKYVKTQSSNKINSIKVFDSVDDYNDWKEFEKENYDEYGEVRVVDDKDEFIRFLENIATNQTSNEEIPNLIDDIKNNNSNGENIITVSNLSQDSVFKLLVTKDIYKKIKKLQEKNIISDGIKKYIENNQNAGPQQYERYLYEFNKQVHGEQKAMEFLNNKSPLKNKRQKYDFEEENSEHCNYYDNIYIKRYINKIEKKSTSKLFKLKGKGNLNNPEHQGLFKNLKKYARLLKHMAGDSQNKLNENDKDARSAHLSIKLLLSKPFKIVVLTAALIFAGTTLLPILANFAFSVGMIPGIIASGGLANPAVQHSLSAALYTGIATIGTGFMAYMVRHLKKKKEQKLAQHEQSSNAAGVNSESQQEQRTDTAGTSSEGQQEQRTDTTGTSSEGQQEETQEVGQKMAEADVLGMINQEFYKLKKSKDAYEEAQDLLENGNNEKNEKINELEETYEIQKEYFVNLLLDYYINYPVKFEGGSLTI